MHCCWMGSVLPITKLAGRHWNSVTHALAVFADALCDYAQPLAPCALSLEGTVLGASQITWVGGRTVLSAAAALGFFSLVSSQGWGLPGVWAGMVLLVICNALLDAWLLLSKHSPIAIKEAAL